MALWWCAIFLNGFSHFAALTATLTEHGCPLSGFHLITNAPGGRPMQVATDASLPEGARVHGDDFTLFIVFPFFIGTGRLGW